MDAVTRSWQPAIRHEFVFSEHFGRLRFDAARPGTGSAASPSPGGLMRPDLPKFRRTVPYVSSGRPRGAGRDSVDGVKYVLAGQKEGHYLLGGRYSAGLAVCLSRHSRSISLRVGTGLRLRLVAGWNRKA